MSARILSKIKMLATLPRSSIFDISFGEDRIFSFAKEPIFKDTFSVNGQGPEKPIIEEMDVEEEIFTFPYPEERGEISDLVNPPVEGIAGTILHTRSKVDKSSSIRKDFSNVFSYLFFHPNLERPIRASEPEFVSLTKQPEIAGSYVGLLAYSSYTSSNANFSYTSNGDYGKPYSPKKGIFYSSDKPLYGNKVPMPMFSGRVYYKAKGQDRLYVKGTAQQKLQIYQNTTQEEISIQPVDSQVTDITYNNAAPNSDSRLNLKLNYEAPKLELPLVRTELPLLDLNIETNENKAAILHLYVPSHNIEDLAVPITLPRLNTVVVPKYDEAKVKYEVVKAIATLPLNLGFDDILLTDRFIERANSAVMVPEQKSILSYAELRALDSRVQRKNYVNAKDENKSDSIEAFSFNYNSKSLDFSLDNQLVVYDKTKVDLDPYALFSLEGNETQTNYQDSLEVRNILLPNTEYKSRSNLDNLVGINYDNRMRSLSGTIADSYNLNFIDTGLQVQVQQSPENISLVNSDYEGMISKQDLEELVEQEKLLTEEEQNIQEEVYDGNIAQEEVYKKTESKEEQETEINGSSDSPVVYLAGAVGAVGLGVLAAVTGAVGGLFKKETSEAKDKEEILEDKKEITPYDSKNKRNSKQCYPTKTELEEKTGGEYKKLIDGQNAKEKKFCTPVFEVNEAGEVFPGGLEFEVTGEDIENFGKIGVRGNNRGRFGGTYRIKKDTLGYRLWDLLVENKGLVPYAKLNRDVNPFEQIDNGQLIFDYLIGLHRDLGEAKPRFFVYDEKGDMIDNTNLNKHLPSGKYKVRILLGKDSNYKYEYRETLEKINQTRKIENGIIAPNLYSLQDNGGKIVEGAIALLDGAFITDSSTDLVASDVDIEKSTLAAQWHKASVDAGLNPNYIRMDTIENGDQKGKNALLVDSFDGANEQYKRRYINAKDELISTFLVKVNLETGAIENEPGYGIEGIETKVQDGFAYVPLVAEQGVDFSGLNVNIKELYEILTTKGMMFYDPNLKYPCRGRLRPLRNFLHEKNKELTIVDGEDGEGYVFDNVRILKAKDRGKTAKEVLEHLFTKAEEQGNDMQREYQINPQTGREELVSISGYNDAALRKLGQGAKIELYLNGIKSSLDTKINPGDKISLAYVATKDI